MALSDGVGSAAASGAFFGQHLVHGDEIDVVKDRYGGFHHKTVGVGYVVDGAETVLVVLLIDP